MAHDETIFNDEDINGDEGLRYPEYEYSVLSHPDSIRVFVLAPSSDSTAHIQGEIVEVRLSEVCVESGYTALSYVWGQDDAKYGILVGDCLLEVRANLFSALCSLRREDRNVRLWVDALCINQDDINERNHQVQQMRRIYSSALETIIYLGDLYGGYTEQQAWSFLERYAARTMNEDGDLDSDLPAKKERQVFLYEVLGRPWFQRLWVLQEAVVSKKLSIQGGHRRISWDDFCKVVILTPKYNDQYNATFFGTDQIDQLEMVMNIFHVRCAYQSLHGMGHLLPSWSSQAQTHKDNILDILDLLRRTRSHQASDPRDKIYGLLGIASGIDTDDQRFAVDYSEDCRDVYTRFARTLILTSKAYDVLSYVNHNPFRYHDVMFNRFGLPSWVPDWDLGAWVDKPLFDTPTILSTLDPETDLKSSEKDQPFHEVCAFTDSGGTLEARGSLIGEVKGLSDVIRLNWMDEKRFQDIQNSDLPENERREQIIGVWREFFTVPYIRLPETIFGVLKRDLFRDVYTPPSDFPPLFEMCWGPMHDASRAEQGPEKGTVEHHLLARSRKTSAWSSDLLLLTNILVDRKSIVDGKRLAVYAPFGTSDVHALAIVPGRTQEGDFLVDFQHGRVPFVLRKDKQSIPDGDEPVSTDLAFRNCEFVGESVVNRVAVDESAWRERIFVIR
ncbi:hypothetical protein O1611_g7280 [Lasiodiplodia mahajangana]|uniref:Uncharacterized protein n=1 Tax=Lasiodiplodia mahajangana TaxID=1108764 RepID=A0ACC2JGK5_9PEZI|nr:hypothetical protein O1611_g7280 [Lasiodiplodia mahajangana]